LLESAARDQETTCMPDYDSRILRFVSGPAGVLLVIFSFKWTDWFGVSYDKIPDVLGAIATFVGTVLGVYLLFYALTGDWLPRLSSHRWNR